MLPSEAFKVQASGWPPDKWSKRNTPSHRAAPMAREDELAAINAYIKKHGVKRVTIDRYGNARVRVVFASL